MASSFPREGSTFASHPSEVGPLSRWDIEKVPNRDFRAATDAMLKLGVSLRQLADGLGVPEARVYQARMNPAASGYRKPPQGWEKALAEVAKRRQGELSELLRELRRRSTSGQKARRSPNGERRRDGAGHSGE